jgi:hypothetical protein
VIVIRPRLVRAPPGVPGRQAGGPGLVADVVRAQLFGTQELDIRAVALIAIALL